MPVEFPSPAVPALPIDPLVDANPEIDPSGVRRKPAGPTASGYSLRDAMVADAEGWDDAESALHPNGWLPAIASSLAIRRPRDMGAFQFVILSKLRAAQLMRGCRPRVDGFHKATVTAQLEVSAGKVSQWLGQDNRPATIAVVPMDDVPVMVVET
jgi:hypothetical protein